MTKNLNLFKIGILTIMLLATLLRLIVFFYNNTFEDDECRLLSAFLDKTWLQMFLNLGDAQSAPPLLIIFERFIGNFLGFTERALKLIPLICSIGSIYLFWKLSYKTLNTNFAIISANLLFAINIVLIKFSSIIKQYSSDVLVCLACILVFANIDILKLSKTKISVLAICFIVLPLVSLPTLFFIFGFLVLQIIKNYKSKVFLKKIVLITLPFLIFLIMYYNYNLAPSKISFEEYFPNYWDDGFMNFSKYNPFVVFAMNLKYLFRPNTYIGLQLILFFIGIYYFYKEKNNYSKLILVSFGFIVLASFLHLYPFIGRVCLYFAPMFILFVTKSLDFIDLKNYKTYLIIFCFILGFGNYNYNYFKQFKNEKNFIDYSPKILMQELKKELNPKTDIILCNSASSSSFLFYSGLIKLKTSEVFEIPIYSKDLNELKDYLDNLKSNQTYWFYLIKDYKSFKIIPTILDWSQNKKIIYYKKDRNSYLIKIEKI